MVAGRFAMDDRKSLAAWLSERGLTLAAVEEATGLDPKVLKAILNNRYTPSPQQRQRLASALGVTPEQITWGHANEVAHLFGHGPQFGRSP